MRDRQGQVDNTKSPSGYRALCVVVLAISIIWLVILPWTARQPVVRQRLEFLDEKGIDPSAMFYTELEVMDSILQKAELEN